MVFKKNKLLLIVFMLCGISTQVAVGIFGWGSPTDQFPDGKKTYKELNSDPENPFVISVGTSMSQTHETSNTVSPEQIRLEIQQVLKKMPAKDRVKWLKDKDRLGFVLRSLPKYICENGNQLDPEKIDPISDEKTLDVMLADMADNAGAPTLMLSNSPICPSEKLTEVLKKAPEFDDEHKQAMIAQVAALGVNKQEACKNKILPNVRLSIEIADVLQEGSDKVDEAKLEKMAAFINDFGNPLLFFHHYANPKVKPHLFEHKEDAKWFAHCCAAILAKCPQVTHVCPISQPIGFSQRVTRQTLPPFHIDIKKGKYVEHIVQAQVLASRAMKKVNPAIHVLVSHQWKPMKPLHGVADPRYPLECLVCKIAHEIYNGGFVNSIEQ